MSMALPLPGTLSPRTLPLGLAGTAALALLLALASQYLGHLNPCELCMDQRWAHVWTIVLLLPAIARPGNATLRRLSLAAGGIGFLVGLGIAGFHVGVEQHWWEGSTSCVGLKGATSLEDLRAQILAAPVVRCDEIQFSLLGLSMAAWNGLLCLILAGLALAAAAGKEIR
jgi:disulfide bond formation protein DsbB